MKTKLTVTIDKDLLPTAKEYARGRNLSLSQLIENCLRELSEERGSSFSDRWRGAFRPAGREDDRYRRLAGKYL